MSRSAAERARRPTPSQRVARRADADARAPRAAEPRGARSAGAGNDALGRTLGGAPLDPQLRAEMEARFGVDFGDVRVHDDPQAHRSAGRLDAQAYTVGDALVFGAGRYAPRSHDGKRLLAHELAHVVQQRRGGAPPPLAPDAPHERAADRAADRVAGGAASVEVEGASAVGIARAPIPEAREDDADALQREREREQAEQARERQLLERAALIVSLVALRRRPYRFHRWYARMQVLHPGQLYAATYALLGPFGFGETCRVDYSADDYLADFDRAVARWAAATKHRFITRQQLAAPIFDPEEIEARLNEVILDELPDRSGFVGTRRDFKAAEQEQIKQRNAQTLQNITAGGLGGAIGWAFGGDVGSDFGATVGAFFTGGRTSGARGKPAAAPRRPAPSASPAPAQRAPRPAATAAPPVTTAAPAKAAKPAMPPSDPSAAGPAKKPGAPKAPAAAKQAPAPKSPETARPASDAEAKAKTPRKQAAEPKSIDEQIADARQQLQASRRKTSDYFAKRKAAGKSRKGGPKKGIDNAKERLWLLERQKAYPQRQLLENGEVKGVRAADGTLTSTKQIAGTGRKPDYIEIDSGKAVTGDLKSQWELDKSLVGGPGTAQGGTTGVAPKSKLGGQWAVEDKVVAHARKTGGKVVITGRDVRTGKAVTLELDPDDIRQGLFSATAGWGPGNVWTQ